MAVSTRSVGLPLRLSLALLLLLLAATVSRAQEADGRIVIGETARLHSAVLGEDRLLLIHRPAGYDRSQAAYPVMYLLDGDAHFHHTTGIIQFLAQQGSMPPMIVVAIPNTERTRDLTPPRLTDTSSRFPTAGGADNFLAFLQEELIPYVETNYRTAPYRVLTGHSFGGLFAVHALFAQPDLFDATISISPALWWDEGALLHAAKKTFAAEPRFDKFLFVTMGNEGGQMLASAQQFAEIMSENAPAGFRGVFRHLPEETHGTVPHRSTYQALEMLYDGWRVPRAVASLQEMQQHFQTASARYGYAMVPPEAVMNRLGYRLLQGDLAQAIDVFKRNVEYYPQSANVYDSLGEAYENNGQFDLALTNYRTAYEKGRARGDPNVEIYKRNFKRVKEKVGR